MTAIRNPTSSQPARRPRRSALSWSRPAAAKPRQIDDVAPAELEGTAGDVGLPPLAVGVVLAVAAGIVVVELAVAARYGYHRDELYFLACARHLAWGYVDQPPLVPAVARVSMALFGSSVVGLRLFPALAGGASVVLSALMARELGGGRRAQGFAALAAACSAQVMSTFHLLSTAAFDLFFWSAVTLLVVHLLRTQDQRWWIAIGAVSGVGMMNKYNLAFLLVAVGIGILASDRRALLRSWWLLAAIGLAATVCSPNLIWNAEHRWAAVTMLLSLHRENSTLSASVLFIPGQLIAVGPMLLPLWLGGLRRLLGHWFARPLAVAYLVLVTLDTLIGAKSYYLGGIYFVLFAGGGLWVEERLATRTETSLRRMAAWVMIGGAVSVPLALPALPVTALATGAWEGKINKDLSATLGWRTAVAQIASIADQLPPAERAHLVVFTGDYGAAGAVDLYGPSDGLPPAISGHNTYWLWGPRGARDGATTIAVNLPRSYLETIFGDVRPAGAINTGHGVWTEENGDPIWICRDQRVGWTKAWPHAEDYG